MLCIKPRNGYVGVKRRLPLETTVRLQCHAEQRHRKAGKVVIINTCVDKGGRKSDLNSAMLVSEVSYYRDVNQFLLPAVFARYQRQLVAI